MSQYARRNLRHCVQYTQYAAVPQCDAASYTVLLTQSGAIHRVLRRVVLRRVLRRAYCGLRVLRTADLRHSTATRRHARWSVLSRNERRRMAPLGVSTTQCNSPHHTAVLRILHAVPQISSSVLRHNTAPPWGKQHCPPWGKPGALRQCGIRIPSWIPVCQIIRALRSGMADIPFVLLGLIFSCATA